MYIRLSTVVRCTVVNVVPLYTGPCIALCMGERGQPTRMLAAKYGGYLTFGALGGGKESAPGQPTLHQLRQIYRLPQLTPACQVLFFFFCTASSCVSLHQSVVPVKERVKQTQEKKSMYYLGVMVGLCAHKPTSSPCAHKQPKLL